MITAPQILAEIERVKSLPVEPGSSAAIVRAQRSGVTYRAEQAALARPIDQALAQQCLADLRAIA